MRVPFVTFGCVLSAGCFTLPAPIVVTSPAPNGTAVEAAFARPDGETMPPRIGQNGNDQVLARIAQAAATVHQQRCRVAVENLANVGTCGWKRRIVRSTTQPITGLDGTVYTLPVLVGTEPVFGTGALDITERNLDLAIDGDGFFAVVTPDGRTGYTRAGSMQINADGKLVSNDGFVVLPEITMPTDTLEISIDPEGRVNVCTAGSPDCSTSLGQLHLHRFINPSGLRVDGPVWRTTEASGAPITNTPGNTGLGLLKQGMLERSNVDANREAMDLQIAEREYATFQEALRRLGHFVP
ncbi:MAG: flagellar hook-basal body complex protein [Planctomycetes bacterium]|nr:flagellar hook-basal body complex protein [Planctomycetota bacterium]